MLTLRQISVISIIMYFSYHVQHFSAEIKISLHIGLPSQEEARGQLPPNCLYLTIFIDLICN